MIGMSNTPQTGTYDVVVNSTSGWTMSFGLTVSPPVTQTLTLGTPQSVSISHPGQFAQLGFTAAAGQNLNVSISSFATSPGGQTATFQVLGPSGNQIAGTTVSSNANLMLNNLSAGACTVMIYPWYASMATFQAEVQ